MWTEIPGLRLCIGRLLSKVDHETRAADLAKLVLFVFRSETIHRELVFAGIEREIVAERVNVEVTVDLADAAVAFVDVDGREGREREVELDGAAVAGATVG